MNHTITLLPSGRSFQCEDGSSILAAGLAAGAGLPFSCRSGVCRTCRGRIVSGDIDPGQVHPAYLTPAEQAEGFVHLCQARASADCAIQIDEIDTSRSFPAGQMPVRVLSMRQAAPDVMLLQLGMPANEPLRFHAGQYLDVLLAPGVRRSYSIANPPLPDGVRQLELHVRHMPGGLFTDSVFSTLQPRTMLKVEAPQGRFALDETSDLPMILLASGTGFAPLKAIVEYSIARGQRRPIHLYWGGRRKADLYLHALAEQWAADHPHIRYTPVLSEATPECAWQGRDGYVHLAVLADYPDLSGHQVYACGAPPMVESARRDFLARAGLPPEAFLADAFVSEADKAGLLTTTPLKEYA
ncbi:MAG: CDP-6-deoxy-delta-3,4-glucoseen reductase [Pseudomonadota bacterium]